MSCFLFLLNIHVQNYKYDLFFMGKLRSAVFDLYIQYIPVFSLYKGRFLFLIIWVRYFLRV